MDKTGVWTSQLAYSLANVTTVACGMGLVKDETMPMQMVSGDR